jgi:hypothetical protein
MLAFLRGCLIRDLSGIVTEMIDWSMFIHLNCVTYEEASSLDIQRPDIARMMLMKHGNKLSCAQIRRCKELWNDPISSSYFASILTEEIAMYFTRIGRKDVELVCLYIDTYWLIDPMSCIRVAVAFKGNTVMFCMIRKSMTPAVFEKIFNVIANDDRYRDDLMRDLIGDQTHHFQARHVAYLRKKEYLTRNMAGLLPWYMK